MLNELDKPKLIKGLQTLAVAFTLIFVGPVTLNFGYNRGDINYWILILGMVLIFCATFVFFLGVKRFLSAFFNKEDEDNFKDSTIYDPNKTE